MEGKGILRRTAVVCGLGLVGAGCWFLLTRVDEESRRLLFEADVVAYVAERYRQGNCGTIETERNLGLLEIAEWYEADDWVQLMGKIMGEPRDWEVEYRKPGGWPGGPAYHRYGEFLKVVYRGPLEDRLKLFEAAGAGWWRRGEAYPRVPYSRVWDEERGNVTLAYGVGVCLNWSEEKVRFVNWWLGRDE